MRKMNSALSESTQETRCASRRSDYSQTVKGHQAEMVQSMLGSARVNEPLHAVIENKLDQTALSESNSSVLERNRALLQYVATIADSNKKHDEFNYEFVESLIKGGADVNIPDQHGQSLFHEVARSWNTDVAKFLLEHGGKINKQDTFGRTPLHVAASVDFVEMTEFLLENNADIDARTFGELQAPIHYAAKNGAVRSLKMLLGYKANIDSLDYRRRTPLQVAAEWTRDKTAKVLIDEGSSSCLLDSSGNSALSVLIDRLPHLALEALNQLHTTDVITQRESYYLNFLESSRMKIETKKARTPLETAVVTRKFEVVSHPVMQRLIHNKWVQFGRLATLLDLSFYVVFNIMWTAMSVLTPARGRQLYDPLRDNIWRVILLILIGIMVAYQVGRQVRATMKTIRAQEHWSKWQTEKMREDLRYCHPRWPQEEKTLKQEIKRISKIKRFSGIDLWFYYDWFVLIVMLAAITSHFVYYKLETTVSRDVYTRIVSVVNLVVWLRLLKNVRPFPGIGTLVIILGETSSDFINWAFLFFLLLIPFASAFWIIFGEIAIKSVEGYETPGRLLFSVFRIAVGDEFNFDELAKAEPVMSRLLTAVYVTAMTIVTLNLLIALLSDTFTRVYGNAVANMIMQRAIKVIEAERALSQKKKLDYREYMRANCSPEVLKAIIDDAKFDTQAEAAKEVQKNVVHLKRVLDDRFAKVYGRNKISDFDKIKLDVRELQEQQADMYHNLTVIMGLLRQLPGGQKPIDLGRSSSPWPSKQSGKQSKIPGLGMLKATVGWINESEEDTTSEKRRTNKKRGGRRTKPKDKHDERRKRGKKRDTNRKSESSPDSSQEKPNTSIVPYGHFDQESGYSYGTSGPQRNAASDLEDWDKLSIDSLTL